MSETVLVPNDVDLTNCDREPIHQLGAIQPIGLLLVLTSDWLISNASANAGEFLNIDERGLIGRPAAGKPNSSPRCPARRAGACRRSLARQTDSPG